MIEYIFWGLVGLVIYNLLGYPLTLFILTVFYKNQARSKPIRPIVSLIIAAYNEEKFIEEKIINSLRLDYPRLEIIVISDGSTDRTDEICRKYNHEINFVRLPRGGKLKALNKIVPLARGKVILLSDANTLYDSNTVKEMVKHFNDPKVGGVVGNINFVCKKGKHKQGEYVFTKLERFIQERESLLGSTVGLVGPINAVRKDLYTSLKGMAVEDFVLGLEILKKGYRVVYDPDANAWEESTPNIKAESERKARIVVGGMQSLKYIPSFITQPIVLWQFFSRKVLRWFMAEILLLIFLFNLLLLNKTPYLLFFNLQLAFYAVSLLGSKVNKLSFFYYFIKMQIASLRGFLRFVTGRQEMTWKRTER